MFIVTLERRSEQTLEREDFQLHGEFLFFFVVFFFFFNYCYFYIYFLSLLLPVFLWSPVALALSLSQATPCTTLPFRHTEALSSRAQCRLNEGGGWEGAATGYKGVGWSNRNGGKNWKNCVRVIRRGLMWGFVPLWSSWLHVQGWRLFWAPNDPFFLPPFHCFLPCVRVEQRPVLYLLSMILASVNAGCGHVSCAVHIKPVRLQCKHTVWMCGIYRVVWLSAFI